MGAAGGLRARVRAELVREIKNAAREQLTQSGAAALSLRAVARELGMVSSAIYRYFPSRDDLLTALILDAYDEIGTATERADAACSRLDFLGRWRATCSAIRNWALAHREEYALVYGSPVPGYRAPRETVAAASRVTNVLAAVIADAAAAGALEQPFTPERTPPLSGRAAQAARGVEQLAGVAPDVVVRGLGAWTQLFGFVSFELFGQLVPLEHLDALFEQIIAETAAYVGLPPPTA